MMAAKLQGNLPQVEFSQMDDKRELFLIVGPKLSVKLSYLNGSLQGTETYYGIPDESYWVKNYPEGEPPHIYINESVAFKMSNGWFLLWHSSVDATEQVGKFPDHMPSTKLWYRDILKLSAESAQ